MPNKKDDLHRNRTFADDLFVPQDDRDAHQRVRDAARKELPKQFYAKAEAAPDADGFAIHLDGKPVHTPGRRKLILPTRGLAEQAAAEWAAQDAFIDPFSMPMTRLANSALDGVAADVGAVAADIVKYAGSDLLCYRAGDPPALAAAQAKAWDPILDFVDETFGARMRLAEGVVFIEQDKDAIAAIARAVDALAARDHAPLRIGALHVVTTLTGSALIALAHAHGALDRDQAWAAAHVDEDEQMRIWGVDSDALRRRAARFAEMTAASAFLGALD